MVQTTKHHNVTYTNAKNRLILAKQRHARVFGENWSQSVEVGGTRVALEMWRRAQFWERTRIRSPTVEQAPGISTSSHHLELASVAISTKRVSWIWSKRGSVMRIGTYIELAPGTSS